MVMITMILAITGVLFIYSWHGPRRGHRLQRLLHCYAFIRCRAHVYVAPLPSNGTCIYSTILAFSRHARMQ
jgi:hypothetical protein